ncbi:MAG: tryptophan-rich sensory protein [Bacteroidota bacterium]
MRLFKPLLQISNIVGLIAVIFFNYVANTGVISGNTVGQVSNSFDSLFAPAGYTFAIWGVIYVGLIGFSIYQARDLFSNSRKNVPMLLQITGWFGLTCAANIVWLVAWLNERIGVSWLLMLALLGGLVILYVQLGIGVRKPKDRMEQYFLLIPFSLYLGWICVATIANGSSFLVSLQWNGFGLPPELWAILMMAVASVLGIMFVIYRNDWVIAGVIAWALGGIAVKNFSQGSSSGQIVGMAAITGILALASAYFLRRRKLASS